MSVTITIAINTVPAGTPLAYSLNPAGGALIDLTPHFVKDGKAVETSISYLMSDTPNNRTLAKRLQKAFAEGAAWYNPEVKKDVNGRDYGSYSVKFRMRELNADLVRLGY